MKAKIIETWSSSTLWSLITANLFVAAMALRFHWSLMEILWIYWSQSVIIGGINFFKLLSLSDFSTAGFTLNDRPVLPNLQTKNFTALFFAFHYGFFHFIYFIFLTVFTFAAEDLHLGNGGVSFWGIVISALIFLANHLYSFFTNWPKEKPGTNIGEQMFIPYLRIIPMHLTIIFGVVISTQTNWFFAPHLLFISLKTLSDVGMHLYEHRK